MGSCLTPMLPLERLKELVAGIEARLEGAPFVELCAFERDGRRLRVALTHRLYKAARRARVWNSKAFLTALKNAEYGFDPVRARSRGGRDGIFLLDRRFKPPNAMMKKLFDGFLDRSGSGASGIAAALGTKVEALLPVRLVSHHMRLVGVLHRAHEEDRLVLVDCDASK